MVILDDDDGSDIEIEEVSNKNPPEKDDYTYLNNLIPKLDISTELIHVQTNLSIEICTSALSYSNLPETHFIIVNIKILPFLKMHNFF